MTNTSDMYRDSSDPKPRRVAYVVKRYPKFSETFVVNEILAHESDGLDIEIFALRPTADSHFQHSIADVRAPVTHLRYGGIKAETLWEELAAYARELDNSWELLAKTEGYSAVEVFQSVQLARAIRANGIQHVHAHFATTASAVARLAALLAGVSYSLTAHAKDIFHESVDECLLRRKLADASAVVTVSDFNVDHLRNRFPSATINLLRVYNGLDLRKYEFCEPVGREPVILAVGRFVEKKGFGILIDACKQLRSAGVEFKCKIVGSGELENEIRARIAEHNLEADVTMLGPRSHTQVVTLMQEAALFVAPCVTASTGDRDGLPTVLLEAMASGTPCVSTDLVGIPEAVRHNETGVLVPEQDFHELALAMQYLLENREFGRNMAVAARKLIEQDFDVHKNAALIRQLFRLPLSKASQPRLAEVG